MRSATLAIALSTLTSVSVFADEGETGVIAAVGIEFGTLRHPRGIASALDTTTITPLLNMSAGAQHGLANWIDVGASLEAMFATNVDTVNASVNGADGSVATGLLLETRLPFAIVAHLDAGLPVSVGLGLEAGPALTLWAGNVLVDRSRPDSNGRPTRLPVDLDDELAIGGFCRLKLSLRARPFDELAVALEPYASFAWSSAAALSVGISVHSTWLPAVGTL